MAKYILSDMFALRGWSDRPFALIRRGEAIAHPLTRAEFLCLVSCDGTEELEDSETVRRLCAEGIIHPADGSRALSDWQSYHFFPKALICRRVVNYTDS